MIVPIHFLSESEYLFGGTNEIIFSFEQIHVFFPQKLSRLQLTTKMASEHKPGGHKLWHAMYMARKKFTRFISFSR